MIALNIDVVGVQTIATKRVNTDYFVRTELKVTVEN